MKCDPHPHQTSAISFGGVIWCDMLTPRWRPQRIRIGSQPEVEKISRRGIYAQPGEGRDLRVERNRVLTAEKEGEGWEGSGDVDLSQNAGWHLSQSTTTTTRNFSGKWRVIRLGCSDWRRRIESAVMEGLQGEIERRNTKRVHFSLKCLICRHARNCGGVRVEISRFAIKINKGEMMVWV